MKHRENVAEIGRVTDILNATYEQRVGTKCVQKSTVASNSTRSYVKIFSSGSEVVVNNVEE